MATQGNCYLCGKTASRAVLKNHLLKEHAGEGEQACYLLQIESANAADYWLFVDLPQEATLSAVDKFLRAIWLECCGHLSEFQAQGVWGGWRKVGKNTLLTKVADNVLRHSYDFGDTTETRIRVVGQTRRPAQKQVVRLLARNVPPVWACAQCGQPATQIDPYAGEEVCDACAATREDAERFLPVVNSPRCGVCGYDGEEDIYPFDPAQFAAAPKPQPKPRRSRSAG